MARIIRCFLALLLVVLPLTTQAGLVTRPSKTCGTNSYGTEVAAGCTTIKSSEVDADLNAIITGGVNNIETSNINPAGLGSTAIANGAVTTAKIATGATVNATASGNVNTGLTFTAETTLVTLSSITTRGGRVLIGGTWGVQAICTAGGTLVGRIRLKRGVTTILTTDMWTQQAGATSVIITLPAPWFTEAPSAGTYTYTITGEAAGGSSVCTFGTPASNAGTIFAVELG